MTNQVAAFTSCVLIDNNRFDVVDIEAQGITEQKDQQERQGKGQIEAADIPEQVVNFLACYRFDLFRIQECPPIRRFQYPGCWTAPGE
ncbi:MAG: hypothetical protein A4E66_01588 [Syntrophus sp. PtaB.Bin001]|nr:MAG: hypothetical protein A4E66_01588 [Syntrophus sp. PtaB.Bin001]